MKVPSSSDSFSAKTTAEEVTQGLNLSGKTIVVTGVNSGLGYETLRVLASRGAHVIAAARSLDKAKSACDSVEGSTTPVVCELSDLDSVNNCAQTLLAMDIAIDAVICNAGIMALADLQLIDGLEKQFFCNHLAHFLLLYQLQPALKRSESARIVMLSSEGHRLTNPGGIDFQNLDGARGYKSWPFYGQSKLANLLTAVAFDRRLKAEGVRANAVHPGVINTNLARDVGGFVGVLLRMPGANFLIEKFGGKTIAQGAATQCYVATHPALEGVGSTYFSDCGTRKKPTEFAQDSQLADRLWDLSVELLQKRELID